MRWQSVWFPLTAVLASCIYVAAWIAWSAPWAWVVSVDAAALEATHAVGVAHPAWVTSWNVLCTVFSPVTFRVLTLGLIVWALMRSQLRLALYLVLAVEVPGLLTELAKYAADRPRPSTALVSASSTSFPSGHALGTMAAVLALLAVALPLVSGATKWVLIASGALIVVAVGVGRVVLNVHHPSDVVAGWALGYVWFVACLPLLSRVRGAAGTPVARDSSP